MSSSRQRQRSIAHAGYLCALAVLLAAGCRSAQLPTTDAAGNPIYLPGANQGALAIGSPPPIVVGPAVPGMPICPPDPCAPAAVAAPPPVVAPLPMPPTIVTPVTYEGLVLRPSRMVSPVGSEVILVATVYNEQGRPRGHQRVEWMLSPDSVGQFYTTGNRGDFFSWAHFCNMPRKLDNKFMVGTTRTFTEQLTRGTPQPNDDLAIGRGQSWASLSSASEGVSYVTAYAPNIESSFQRQQQRATIYWIDAQFQYPSPAVAAVGSRHVFNTTVLRQTNGTPVAGWLVRYEIVGGEGTVFAPNGTTSIEVPTDAGGVAAVEVFQTNPQRGGAQIQVQIIRPERDGERLAVGTGSTSITWTAPDIDLQITGPASAEVGSTASYRIDVSNPGDLPVNDVVVTNPFPRALSYVSSTPQANQSPSSLEWRLGTLGPRQQTSISVNYRVEQGGVIENCAEANTSEGLAARNCTSMNTIAPGVEIQVDGAQTANVGDEVRYRITVINRGAAPATGLVIRDTFDAGLEHTGGAGSPIVRELGTLAAGAARDDISVTFRVTRAGRLCQTIEVTGDGVRSSARQVCLTATPATQPEPAPGPFPPGPVEPGPAVPDSDDGAARPGLSVEKRGPAAARIGDEVQFTTIVTNTGDTVLRDVRLVDDYELGLEPTRAEPGHSFENDQLNWRITELRPGESQQFRVLCRATRAPRACSRATVTALGDLVRVDETCVDIQPAAAPPIAEPPITPPVTPPPGNGGGIGVEERALSVQITDLDDEVPVGGRVTYVVRVTNNLDRSDQNVVVVVNVPAGMTPQALGINAPARHTIVGQQLQFNPVAEIRPGETLPYRFSVEANQPGRVQVQVQVTSDTERQPIVATEETSIFRGQ